MCTENEREREREREREIIIIIIVMLFEMIIIGILRTVTNCPLGGESGILYMSDFAILH